MKENATPERPCSPLMQAFNQTLLTINCVACVPMYSMLFWQVVYWGACCKPNKHGTSWFSYQTMEWFRRNPFFRGVARYFPVQLHKTQDLSPDSRYVFLYHPHGVISMGANVALMTNGCHFDQLYPGVERHGVTLNVTFWSPIFREWMLALGYIGCSKATLLNALQYRSIVLVPGGAAEALHAHEDNFKLHLRNRKGFVKLAMESGAKLVPCLGFGENEAFETYYCPTAGCQQSKGSISDSALSLLWYLQQRLYRVLPNQRPIHVVVGAPVEFDKNQTLDDCHALYMKALRDLYNQHRGKYGYQDMDIEII